MEKIVAFFNHKGGVGKTTQLYNLAWTLANQGKKVLMVDADSQCNLSTISLGEERFEEHYISFPNDNIKSAVDPAFEARPTLIQAIECPQIDDKGNLFLLPGSFEISSTETQLSVAINFNVTFLTMTNLPGAFYNLIHKCAEKYQVEIVLIDLNPALSALNQTLLFSSDYFVIPCGVDYFSKQAIRSLSKILPTWISWSEKAQEHFKESVYPLPKIKTKFLGYTVNNYNVRNQNPTKRVQGVINRIDDEVSNYLVPALLKTESLVVSENYRIAEINNFNSLQQVSHEMSKPVVNLTTEDDTKHVGTVADNEKESIDSFKNKFKGFADYIIEKAQ